MHRHWLARIGLVLCIVPGLLVAGSLNSSADSEGVELIEAVSIEASGDESYAAVQDAGTFDSDGGEAVFEPGTDSEERFTYAAVDRETNRLIGLTRPYALPHAAGTLVAPVPVVGDAAGEPESGREEELVSDSSEAQDAETALFTPSPCDMVEPSCEELITEICAEGIVCDILQDPHSLCEEGTVCDILQDPHSLCEEGTVCDILQDPDGTCASPTDPLVANVCEAPQNPLGWSVCDVDNTDASCPDPEDVIDLVYGVDNPLSDLECTASTEGPWISAQGGMVRGRGEFTCHEAVEILDLRVCLHWRSGGAWVKLGCRYEPGFFAYNISKKIAERCIPQQTVKYRIRARGEAEDGGEFDYDKAVGIAELYCPGTEPSGATTEAGEYADTWVPGSG